MGSNKVAFSAIGLACVVAAGTGGYFALRQNAAPDNRLASPALTTSATRELEPAAGFSDKPVSETEAVVAPPEKTDTKVSKKPEPKAQKAQSPVSSASTVRQGFPPPTA